MDWLDLLAVQGTLKSLLQHHSSKASILLCSAFFSPTLTSIHDHWKNHSLDQTDLCWQSNVSAFEYADMHADDTTLMAESEEELKSLLMKVKEESEKVGLKLNIHKMKIMASGPITSWELHGETVSDFIFWGSKITADGDCSHEMKRLLLLGKRVMTNLDSILKSKHITLLTKVHLVKAMVFPVVMYGCESWDCEEG